MRLHTSIAVVCSETVHLGNTLSSSLCAYTALHTTMLTILSCALCDIIVLIYKPEIVRVLGQAFSMCWFLRVVFKHIFMHKVVFLEAFIRAVESSICTLIIESLTYWFNLTFTLSSTLSKAIVFTYYYACHYYWIWYYYVSDNSHSGVQQYIIIIKYCYFCYYYCCHD